MEEVKIEKKEIPCDIKEPTIEFKDSYLMALDEYHQEGMYLGETRDKIEKSFANFVQHLRDKSLGVNLKPGRVPETEYWIVDADGFAGRVSLRHELSENLLKLGGNIGYDVRPSKRGRGYGNKALELVLPKARALGLSKVLLTCDSTNIASRKIIEANGGILENEVSGEEGQPTKLRFWIKL